MSVLHVGARMVGRQGNAWGTSVGLSGHLLTDTFNCHARP